MIFAGSKASRIAACYRLDDNRSDLNPGKPFEALKGELPVLPDEHIQRRAETTDQSTSQGQ